jgi:hypothetical protein
MTPMPLLSEEKNQMNPQAHMWKTSVAPMMDWAWKLVFMRFSGDLVQIWCIEKLNTMYYLGSLFVEPYLAHQR